MTEPINLFFTTIKDELPAFIYEGLAEYSRQANAYRAQPPELVGRIAKMYQVPKEMILLTAGIDEAIQIFAKSYGQNAYVFTPTYVVYTDVEEFGGKLNKIFSIKGATYSVSTEKIPDATLLFLANPNNPSGVTQKKDIVSLVKNNPQAIVVVDEAYGEFADLSVIDQVEKFPNLAVFRSFSKAYGMAGNRIGYVVAHREILDRVKNKTQWANVSYLSIGAAMVALDHQEYFRKMRDDITKRRDECIEYLTSLGFTLLPSKINAMLFQFSSVHEGTRFADFLSAKNFIISHGNGKSNIGLDESFVRVAVGTQEQMKKFKQVIQEFKI